MVLYQPNEDHSAHPHSKIRTFLEVRAFELVLTNTTAV